VFFGFVDQDQFSGVENVREADQVEAGRESLYRNKK
jgi:hypothetical protein